MTCPKNFLQKDLESGLTKDGQMKRKRFTEEQIIAVLKEHEAGAKTADLARKHGISEARCTTGRPCTAAWTCRTPNVCVRWKTRTAS